jgi:4-amino-4-deoxy-L-arabinose transferase-like glycosyltransferase
MVSVATAVVRESAPGGRPSAASFAAIGLVAAALYAIRLTGVPDLMENEYRLGAYVIDILQHGHWLCPRDSLGNTDKPPMLAWLAALASWPLGRPTLATMYLPSALATAALAWIVLGVGTRRFGPRAGVLGALAYLLCDVGARQVATARWDGLFSLTVALAALAAWRAWSTGAGWTWFWLAAAVSTLTKGPLGVVLASLGLLAVAWERRSGHAARLVGSHRVGVLLFVVLTVGWFVLAYGQVGPHLVSNMVGDEFVGNMTEHHVGYRFWKPPGDFIANFAPWSVLTVLGLWRTVTSPAATDEERRFERFLFCWLVGGLAIFCVSPHNQSRLLYPMIPPAALLAGRELARLTARLPDRLVVVVAGAAIAAALAVFVVRYDVAEAREPAVRETVALERLAHAVRTTLGDDVPLTYVDGTPFAFQILLNTMRPTASLETAAALLRGDAFAVVAVRDVGPLRRALGPDAIVHELTAAADGGTAYLHVVANRARITPDEPVATAVGPLVVTTTHARLGPTWDDRLVLRPDRSDGGASVESRARAPVAVAVRIDGGPDARATLAPGERWHVDVPGRMHGDP